jgi:hypothetical protein
MFREITRQKRIAFFLWLSSAGFVCWALIFKFSPDFARSFLNSYFGLEPEKAIGQLDDSFMHVAFVCLVSATIYQHWIKERGKLPHAAFATILLLDLIWAGFDVNHFAPKEFFQQEPALVKTVKAEVGSGRFYRPPNLPNLNLNLPANEVVYFNRWHLETLNNYSAALYSIPVIYHEDFDNLAQKELVKISDHLLRSSWDKRLPFLEAGAVSIFLTADRLTLPGVQLIASIKNSSNVPFFLYRDSTVSNQIFFVPEALRVSNNEDAFRKMNETGFHPLKSVFISANENIPATDPSSCGFFETQTLEAKTSRLKIQTRSECDSFLYFAQPFYKGWHTLIDGKESPVFRANYAFSASFVKAGQHVIERVYKPQSVRIGMIVTTISALLSVVIVYSGILLRAATK